MQEASSMQAFRSDATDMADDIRVQPFALVQSGQFQHLVVALVVVVVDSLKLELHVPHLPCS